jgi:uncharacterized protein (DUF1015 family)
MGLEGIQIGNPMRHTHLPAIAPIFFPLPCAAAVFSIKFAAMAHIRPFRAWRYAGDHEVEQNFSPLFDVVSPEQLGQLYSLPNNSIHISVPLSDDHVLEKWQSWKDTGVVRQDSMPAIYVYYQEFSLFGDEKKYVRKGFVSMIRIQEPAVPTGTELILHEGTISASVADRRRLLERLMLNTAPTHGLYEDPEFQLEAIMDAYMVHPDYSYIDYQGVINKLAVVQDRRDILRFQAVLDARPVYLADGHHRLASSVALREKALREGWPIEEDSPLHYHMMYLTNLCSDDLRILPIHRVFHLPERTFNPNPILGKLREYFNITDITFAREPIYQSVGDRPRAFGMVMGSTQFLLELRPEIDPIRDIDLPLPDAVKNLDYTLLHYFIFDKVLGAPYLDQHAADGIHYVKDYGVAVKQAVTWPNQLTFITRGTTMDQMMDVCRSGALMPQKSTYFYPKVVCGLVFASIREDENKSPFDLGFRQPPPPAPAP